MRYVDNYDKNACKLDCLLLQDTRPIFRAIQCAWHTLVIAIYKLAEGLYLAEVSTRFSLLFFA